MSYVDPSKFGDEEELPHGSFALGRNTGLVSLLNRQAENNTSVWVTNMMFEPITVLVQVVLYNSSGKKEINIFETEILATKDERVELYVRV